MKRALLLKDAALQKRKRAASRAALVDFAALHSQRIAADELTLRELEAAAGLGAAVLLAFDDARVAGQEAALLQDAAQIRFHVGQRLGQAVAHRAGLARQTATGHGADDVVLVRAGGSGQRLLDHHAQHRTGEVDFLVTGVDRDLAGARLDPDAGDGVLALAGGIGATQLVDLLDVLRCFRSRRLERRQLVERLNGLGHDYAALVFLRFNDATSMTCGCCASCGCSAPA